MEYEKYKVKVLKEAMAFVGSLPKPAAKKVRYNLHRVAAGEVNSEIFKKLEGCKIWEFRTLYDGIAYRLFAFWDTKEDTIIVATHGFIKKKDETPKGEITKAERIRKSYFKSK